MYGARDLRHDRQVAVKVLPPELATAIAAERFLFEIRAAAQLLHPHILGLIDSGDADGVLYYIMPHVRGETLRDKLDREKRLSMDDAARITREVASALTHAHEHGLVHRDIKPENILLVDGRHAMVADFGLARAILRSADRKLTLSKHLIGTLSYMSPEQAASEEGVDGRSDIYSLGCMLFELLAGHPPFQALTDLAIITKHLREPPPRLSGGKTGVPLAVERVVHRALEKEPARRFQVASDLSRELDAAIAGAPRPWYARWLWPLVGAAAVVIGAGSWWLTHRDEPARRAIDRGVVALNEWDLAGADSDFAIGFRGAPRNGEAALNSALVKLWRGAPQSDWSYPAQQAVLLESSLDQRQRTLANALLALVRGRVDSACATWQGLARASSASFYDWYGLGYCLQRDTVVIRDGRSPSGWAFRSSYQQSIAAFDRALALVPHTSSFRVGAMLSDMERRLKITGSVLRGGHAASPDSVSFNAYPSWNGDSVGFVPFPREIFVAQAAPTRTEALVHLRQHFYQTARMLRSAFPTSVEAVEAVATSLDALGDPSAIDTLRLARRTARTAMAQIQIGSLAVWLEVRRSLPADIAHLRSAKYLADSLLSDSARAQGSEATALAGLAALTGRARLAVKLALRDQATELPLAVRETAPSLLLYAAFGGPPDTIAVLEARLRAAMTGRLTKAEQETIRSGWILRSALLAVPNVHISIEDGGSAPDNAPMRMLRALASRDLLMAQRATADQRRDLRRAQWRAANISPDALYSTGAVLASLGDPNGAVAWLDPTLDSLGGAVPRVLATPPNAAALVRAMILRSELAKQMGDQDAARRWAAAVLTLWENADEFLKPTVRQLGSFPK